MQYICNKIKTENARNKTKPHCTPSTEELASIFQSQTRATHGILISVTQTKISPDLSICTAYLSIFPSDKAEELLKNINKNEKTIRYDLGQRVRSQLRIIPELRFFLDDSLDYIEHIDELLKK